MLFRNALAAIIVLMISATQAFSLDVPFKQYVLGNGMQLVVIPDHRAPVVTHSVWYRVGSADETSGKSGLAHFLEHLMFKGTPLHPYGDFDHLITVNGAESNAFTTRDYTAYYQRTAADRLPLMMELESDRMQNLILTDENVKPELLVVREERRQRTENDPGALLAEQMDAAMFTAHPYGRPTVGWMSEVANLTRQDAISFYKAHYTPANAVLIVAGDADPDKVKLLADKYYGSLKNTFVPEPRSRTPEPAPIVARRLTMTDERASTPYVSRSYLTPSDGTDINNEAVALDFLSGILGHGPQSRLYQALVMQQKLATDAGSYFNGAQLDSGSFGVYGVPNPGVDVNKVETAINAVLADVVRNGVTQKELDRVRNQALASQIYALDDQMSLLQFAGASLMTGVPIDEAFSIELWNKITIEDIRTVAAKYIRPENSVTGILLPAQKS
jgi:zinc protease